MWQGAYCILSRKSCVLHPENFASGVLVAVVIVPHTNCMGDDNRCYHSFYFIFIFFRGPSIRANDRRSPPEKVPFRANESVKIT